VDLLVQQLIRTSFNITNIEKGGFAVFFMPVKKACYIVVLGDKTRYE